MKRLKLLLMLIAVVVLCTACDTSTPTAQPVAVAQAGPVAWIDAPLNRSDLPLAPYEIVFHCSVPSGVAWVELTVDGAILVSNAPVDTTQSLVTMRYVWTPPAPGNYTLRARARDHAGVWGEYATAVVTVEGETLPPTLSPTPIPPTPETATLTPSPIPPTLPPPPTLIPPTLTPVPPTSTPIPPTPIPPTSTPPPQPPTISGVQPSVNVFYSDGKCGVTQLTLQATVDDSDGVSSVTFNYWLKDKVSGAESGWAVIVPMQRVGGSATHGTWAATLDGPAAIGASPGHEYTLRYYLVAADALGTKTQSPTYENVTLNTRSCVH
jgi:hypothetical protein